MRPVDFEKLKRAFRGVFKSNWLELLDDHGDVGECELTPAELSALNLKAMMVLKEFENRILMFKAQTWTDAWLAKSQQDKSNAGDLTHLANTMLESLADLEAKFPDEKVQDVLVKARAWEKMIKDVAKGFKVESVITAQVKQLLKDIQDEARTDVRPSGRAELGGKEKTKMPESYKCSCGNDTWQLFYQEIACTKCGHIFTIGSIPSGRWFNEVRETLLISPAELAGEPEEGGKDEEINT